MKSKRWATTNKTEPTNWMTVKIIEKRKYNKSKFLNPSLTGNLFIVLEQESSSISLIPINFPRPSPFLYWSINDEIVYTRLN